MTQIGDRRVADSAVFAFLALLSTVAAGTSACAQLTKPPTLVVKQVVGPLEEGRPSPSAAVILMQREKYPPKQIESLVVELDRLTTTATSPMAQLSAAQALSNAGTGPTPVAGAFDRILSAYGRSDDALVRRAIVSLMSAQHDRARAIAFLREVAIKPSQAQDFEGSAKTAVEALARMEKDGRAELIALKSKDAISDPAASAYVNWFLSVKH